MNKTLYVMCGLAGAGKSTVVNALKNKIDQVVSMDDIREKVFHNRQDQSHNKRVFEIAIEKLHGLGLSYREEGAIWYDATNIKADGRKKLVEDMRLYYKNIICIFVDKTAEDCIVQDCKRPQNQYVGAKVIRKMEERFEVPTFLEGWDKIIKISSIC